MTPEEIYKSRAFAYLQQGMKDKNAYGICLAVANSNFWQEFELFCLFELALNEQATEIHEDK